jgi:histidinol-phosphate/aromatic aminotransferase/cobyric acid decarboxylase-like protein
MTASTRLDEFVVPAARALPSNADYLAHLAASFGDSSLIRLASNENTEPPSPRVRAALEGAYNDVNLSPPPVPALRLALAERHGVDPAQVLVTAGSTEVIDAILRTFVRAGTEVLIPEPSWPVCRMRLQVLDASVVAVPLRRSEAGYAYDVAAYLDALTPETKLVVVCSPNNPTGNAMELDDIRRLAQTGVPLLLDAAYADFDPGRDPMPLVHEYDNVVVTRRASATRWGPPSCSTTSTGSSCPAAPSARSPSMPASPRSRTRSTARTRSNGSPESASGSCRAFAPSA